MYTVNFLKSYEISQQLLSDWSPSEVSKRDASTFVYPCDRKFAAPLTGSLFTAQQILVFSLILQDNECLKFEKLKKFNSVLTSC